MNDLSRKPPLSEDEMQEELDFIEYENAKKAKLTNAAIVWHFGSRKAARLEMRYQAEQAAKHVGLDRELVGALSTEEHREIPRSYSDPGQYCPGCSSRISMCWCGQSRITSIFDYKGDRR